MSLVLLPNFSKAYVKLFFICEWQRFPIIEVLGPMTRVCMGFTSSVNLMSQVLLFMDLLKLTPRMEVQLATQSYLD